ncbi:MAG: sporulation initiation factor Spo0A C-terminal domain-containing protein [Clostridia bacterium]|nr:sporulation initiation factor Spo0A C-terminal domain-containing protein [Clostridia bacterium]
MERSRLIVEQRGLILGEENEYYRSFDHELNALARMKFIYVSTEKQLIEKCYEYEPMLIVMELDPKNLSIAINASLLAKYRQSVTIGLTCGENESFDRLVNENIITNYTVKTGNTRTDSLNVLRLYKISVKYGINLNAIAKQMPIVNELMWHDISYDERFLRDSISDKLDRLGVRKELAGHKYLIAAIAMQSAIKDAPEPKKLYGNIAEYYDTTPLAVEKAIRYAIETAWIVGDIEYQHEIFGMSVDENKGKPTNAEFISRLSIEY